MGGRLNTEGFNPLPTDLPPQRCFRFRLWSRVEKAEMRIAKYVGELE